MVELIDEGSHHMFSAVGETVPMPVALAIAVALDHLVDVSRMWDHVRFNGNDVGLIEVRPSRHTRDNLIDNVQIVSLNRCKMAHLLLTANRRTSLRSWADTAKLGHLSQLIVVKEGVKCIPLTIVCSSVLVPILQCLMIFWAFLDCI